MVAISMMTEIAVMVKTMMTTIIVGQRAVRKSAGNRIIFSY